MSSLPIINTTMMKEITKRTFIEGVKRPLFFLGKGGIGKTEIIAELAKEMNIGYIDIRLLLYTETDIKGIPYPDDAHKFTIWLQNDILPRADKHGEKGILVFDEITSAMKSVRTAIYQLLNERKLGEYELPEGWNVVCLGNGEEDGGDYNGMEGNFANRCSMFRVTPDIEAFKDYAGKDGFNSMVLAFLSWQPSSLHTYAEGNGSEEDSLLFASPRSWKAVSDLLNATDSNIDMITELRIKSNIGTVVGETFTAFCKFRDKQVDTEAILEGRTKKVPSETEAVYLTVQSLVQLMAQRLKEDANNHRNKVSKKIMTQCSNGLRWILSIKSVETAVMGVKDFISLAKREAVQLLMSEEFDQACPEFEAFATKHKDILR